MLLTKQLMVAIDLVFFSRTMEVNGYRQLDGK